MIFLIVSALFPGPGGTVLPPGATCHDTERAQRNLHPETFQGAIQWKSAISAFFVCKYERIPLHERNLFFTGLGDW